ncbi:hypothetical protein KCP75_16355 [Salmonella enterica subsp. enterica]|nr:hypothetical protein KCP75_16355 [Salmonella enterica subsp. enterica]
MLILTRKLNMMNAEHRKPLNSMRASRSKAKDVRSYRRLAPPEDKNSPAE